MHNCDIFYINSLSVPAKTDTDQPYCLSPNLEMDIFTRGLQQAPLTWKVFSCRRHLKMYFDDDLVGPLVRNG